MRWGSLRSLGGAATLGLLLLLQGQPVRSDIPIDVSSAGMWSL
jgi:hypothetical protein